MRLSAQQNVARLLLSVKRPSDRFALVADRLLLPRPPQMLKPQSSSASARNVARLAARLQRRSAEAPIDHSMPEASNPYGG